MRLAICFALAVVIGCGPSSKKNKTVVRGPEATVASEKEDAAESAEVKEMRRRCNDGEAAGCIELGDALRAAGHDAGAGTAFELACSIGEPSDCAVAAEKCKNTDAKCNTVALATVACVRDHDLCGRGAKAIKALATTAKPPGAMVSAAKQLVAFECVVSGEPYEKCGIPLQGDDYRHFEDSVFEWLEESCGWDRTRCYRYALIAASIDGGSGTTKKLAKAAMHVHKTECRYGDPVSCVQEGFAFLRGDERSVDRDMAEVLFAEGCNAGEAWGCTALADMYRKDEDSQEKRLQCTSLYEDACEGGDPEGCWKLGKLFLSGTIVAQDTKKATGLFRRACELGNQAGCDFFGDN